MVGPYGRVNCVSAYSIQNYFTICASIQLSTECLDPLPDLSLSGLYTHCLQPIVQPADGSGPVTATAPGDRQPPAGKKVRILTTSTYLAATS